MTLAVEPPTGWKVRPLTELVTKCELGGTYKNGSSLSPVPLVKMGNLGRGRISIATLDYVEDPSAIDLKHLLVDGDLLFNTRNTLELVGKVALWRSERPGAVYDSNILRLAFDASLISGPAFMNYWFNSQYAIRELRRRAIGTTSVAAIYWRDLRTLRVALPPISEQGKVVAVLSTWDRAIELTEKLIAAKRKRKHALMQRLLTGKVRLREFDGSQKWKTAALGKIATLSSGGTPSKARSDYWDGDIPWVTAKDLKRPRLIDSIDHVSERAIGNGTRLMPAGTVFILVRGMTLLKDVPVCIASVPMCFNQDIRAMTVHEGYDHRFVAYALVANKLRLMSLVNVAGHGTGRLATEFLVEFPIELPPTAGEQAAIADVIEDAEKEVTLLNTKLELLRSQKKGLMQQLLTGKVRVKVDDQQPAGVLR